MDDLTEEELRQIVSGTSNDWMDALKEQHPDWIMQAIQSQPASSETGEMAGPIEGYTFYDPKKTKAGEDKFKRYDVSGKLLGEQQFKKPGNAWDMTKQFVADVGPLLQFVPTLAPFVRAISALSAAEQGNILGALASGLPLADKIPGLDKATVTALQNAGKYASVASAAKSKDPMQLLNALSQTPEFGGKVPPELKTIGDYASKAGALQRASKGDIGALLGLTKGVTAPGKSYFPGYDAPSTGEEGFFAPGGPGDVEPEAGDLPDWALDPYKDVNKPGAYYSGLENITDEWDEADIIPDTYGTGSGGPADQSVEVTGTLPKTDVVIPDWDFMEVPDRTPGSPMDTTPKPPTPDDDRTSGLPTVPGGGKTNVTKPATKPGMSMEDVMRLLDEMQRKRPEQEKYELFSARPFGYDLMYGLKG